MKEKISPGIWGYKVKEEHVKNMQETVEVEENVTN
jgi:hypothetical protein